MENIKLWQKMSPEEKIKHEWAIEKYPDGWDIIVKGDSRQIVLGASLGLEKALIKYIVSLHNESIAPSLFT